MNLSTSELDVRPHSVQFESPDSTRMPPMVEEIEDTGTDEADLELEDDLDDRDEDDNDEDIDGDEEDIRVAEEEVPSRRSKKPKDEGPLLASDDEGVVKANPKRNNRQKREVLTNAGAMLDGGAAAVWSSMRAEKSRSRARKYSHAEGFGVSDFIDHPAFGKGYVVEILSSTKMTVVFEDGFKKLAQSHR